MFSAIYSIFLFNRINFLGFSPYLNLIQKKNNSIENWQGDLTRLEFLILLPLLLLTIIFGLFPNLILDSLHYSVSNLIYNVNF